MKRRILILLCAVLVLSGCSVSNSNTETESTKSTVVSEKEEIIYTSKIEKDECALCGNQEKSLLPAYKGQKNLGIICINTLDVSPVSINRYNDYGSPIEENAGYTSITHNGFGEGGMSTSVIPNSDRGFANVDVYFSKDKQIDKNAVENLFCSDCLDAIMEDTWGEPYGIGVINFETLEIRLFEKNVTAFTFGDYYIDVDHNEKKEETDQTELDLLIFYCPPRYK